MAKALVVIDMQMGMLGETPPPYRADKVVQRAADLLARARAAGAPVFHVQHDGGPGDSLAKGAPGFAHHPALAPRPGEPVIEKRHVSAFHDTDFQAQLAGAGIDHLIIASCRKPSSLSAPKAGASRDGAVWRWGFATALANPKAVVFFSSLFLSLLPAQPSLAIQIAAVVTIGLVSLLCDFCVACAFSHPLVQAAYGRVRHWIDRIAGGILIAVGLRVAITR
jgi:hypothetical protein